jgi:Endosomal/lysosomal potassium channel TMEM175
VLAIAITLLVIEIHPPEIHQGKTLAHALWAQWPSYLAYMVSFLANNSAARSRRASAPPAASPPPPGGDDGCAWTCPRPEHPGATQLMKTSIVEFRGLG